MKTLAATASSALKRSLSVVGDALGSRFDEVGDFSVLFTWAGRDYKVSISPYLDEVPRKPARKKDFQSLPFPKKRAVLGLRRKFTLQEFNLLRLGFLPSCMEDRWFLYYSEARNELRIHRSWTGFCIYLIKFAEEKNLSHVSASYINRDPEQNSQSADLTYEREVASWLIDNLLLEKRTQFPRQVI